MGPGLGPMWALPSPGYFQLTAGPKIDYEVKKIFLKILPSEVIMYKHGNLVHFFQFQPTDNLSMLSI